MEEIIRAHRDAIGIRPREIDEQEIVQRLVYALVNEGARILEEGIASRASDIDMVYILGYGFPAWKGGPMHYANEQGLSKVVRTMQSFAQNPQADPAFWQPAPAIERLAEHYDTF